MVGIFTIALWDGSFLSLCKTYMRAILTGASYPSREFTRNGSIEIFLLLRLFQRLHHLFENNVYFIIIAWGSSVIELEQKFKANRPKAI